MRRQLDVDVPRIHGGREGQRLQDRLRVQPRQPGTDQQRDDVDVSGTRLTARIDAGLSLSVGFGGHNVALVLAAA